MILLAAVDAAIEHSTTANAKLRAVEQAALGGRRKTRILTDAAFESIMGAFKWAKPNGVNQLGQHVVQVGAVDLNLICFLSAQLSSELRHLWNVTWVTI